MSFINYRLLGSNCSVEKNVLVSNKKYFSPFNDVYVPPPMMYYYQSYPDVDAISDQQHNRKLRSCCQHCLINNNDNIQTPPPVKPCSKEIDIKVSKGCSRCSMRG